MPRSRLLTLAVPALGLCAGLAALVLDEAVAAATLGAAIPLHFGFAVAYATSGIVAATLVAACAALARRGPLTAGRLAALSLALLYVPPVAERVYHAALGRLGSPLAALAVAVACLVYAAAIALLARLAGSLSAAATLAAVAAATALAVNRNLVEQPFSATALGADLAVVVATLALAFLVRAAGIPRTVALAALLTAGLGAIAILAHADSGRLRGQAGAARPDVLLVVVDTLRADVFAEVMATTPEGRALRRALPDAAWFDDAVAVGPWTAPTVATLLTGLYPDEHGFGHRALDRSRPLERLASGITTLAETFDAAGFHTEALVTNPLLHPVSGLDRGFDRYELLAGPTSKLPLLTALAEIELVPGVYYQRAAAVRRRFAGRLEQIAGGDAPLFFWLHFLDPHHPLLPHPQLPDDPREATLPAEERLYRREVRYAVAEIARCLDLLRDHGRWPRTAVAIVSDHGEMFPSDGHLGGRHPTGKPGNAGHGHALYEELVRVPLVLRPPGGLPRGRRVTAMVSQVDVHDTLVDLAGLAAEPARSLSRFLGPRPPRLDRRPPALLGATNRGPPQRGIRVGRWKLISHPTTPGRAAELYDLATDPAERRDLAGRHPRAVRELEARLARQLADLRPVAESAAVAADEETRRRLRALGYLDEAGPPATDEKRER